MWNNTEKIFIIGICGISLSALARVLKCQGHEVWGSDVQSGEMAERLERCGIHVAKGHNKANLKDADIVVYTVAAHEDNEELIEARHRGLKIYTRAELLGLLSKHYKKTIAIAGSHGKTTTTGMVSTIFINAGLEPTVHIGGNFSKIGGNVRLGKSEYFITEACEYCDSYLKLSPEIGVVLGVQADHLDYFKNVARVQASFEKFSARVKKKGCLIINADNPRCSRLGEHAKGEVVRYSKKNGADYTAANLKSNDTGCFAFDLLERGKLLGRVYLSAPGEHNVYNALAAIAVARRCKIDFLTIAEALNEFCGVERRFELVGKINGARVYHDYAHHPTEIKATIATARLVSQGRLFVVFQPHTYSRTKSFFCQFAKSLSRADFVLMYPIYPARERPIEGITSDALAEKIESLKTPSICLHSYGEILETLKQNVDPNDMILILGAGDIVDITKQI